jgi:hypothetical protein
LPRVKRTIRNDPASRDAVALDFSSTANSSRIASQLGPTCSTGKLGGASPVRSSSCTLPWDANLYAGWHYAYLHMKFIDRKEELAATAHQRATR